MGFFGHMSQVGDSLPKVSKVVVGRCTKGGTPLIPQPQVIEKSKTAPPKHAFLFGQPQKEGFQRSTCLKEKLQVG